MSDTLSAADPRTAATAIDLQPERRSGPLDTLRRLLDSIPIAMLTNRDDAGDLQSRPMALQQLDDDGRLWFFASRSSHQVDSERADPHVNLAFVDAGRQHYVSITGRIRVLDDAAKRHELWKPTAKIWFKEGADDPDLVLLRVQPDYADYWESPGNAVTRLIGFATALITGDDATLGKQGHLTL